MKKEEMKKHFDFLRKTIGKIWENDKPTNQTQNESLYPWIGELEKRRLFVQNESAVPDQERIGWAFYHNKFFQMLADAGINPEKLIMIGTGYGNQIPDAFLFPSFISDGKGKVYAIELDMDGEKIVSSKNFLEKRGLDLDKVEFVKGNAAIELERFGEGEIDLIDTQIVEMHLSTRPPAPWLPKEEVSKYSTLQQMIEARVRVLKKGGKLTTADLTIGGDWGFKAAPGFEENEEVKKIVEKANQLVPALLDLGWRNRGAIPWKDKKNIIETIESLSHGRLKLIPELSEMVCVLDPAARLDQYSLLHTTVAYVVCNIILANKNALLGVQKASQANPENPLLKEVEGRMTKGVEFLKAEGLAHIRMLMEERRVVLCPVNMYFLTFEKIN